VTIAGKLKETSMLRTMLRGFSDAHRVEANTSDAMRAAHEEEVRQARLAAARRNSRWTELNPVDLVPRNRGWLVAASDDAIYSPIRGAVFQPHSASAIADMTKLFYFVDADGEVVFLEQVTRPATYTEHLEQAAERAHRRSAPKPRPKWAER